MDPSLQFRPQVLMGIAEHGCFHLIISVWIISGRQPDIQPEFPGTFFEFMGFIVPYLKYAYYCLYSAKRHVLPSMYVSIPITRLVTVNYHPVSSQLTVSMLLHAWYLIFII